MTDIFFLAGRRTNGSRQTKCFCHYLTILIFGSHQEPMNPAEPRENRKDAERGGRGLTVLLLLPPPPPNTLEPDSVVCPATA